MGPKLSVRPTHPPLSSTTKRFLERSITMRVRSSTTFVLHIRLFCRHALLGCAEAGAEPLRTASASEPAAITAAVASTSVLIIGLQSRPAALLGNRRRFYGTHPQARGAAKGGTRPLQP